LALFFLFLISYLCFRLLLLFELMYEIRQYLNTTQRGRLHSIDLQEAQRATFQLFAQVSAMHSASCCVTFLAGLESTSVHWTRSDSTFGVFKNLSLLQ